MKLPDEKELNIMWTVATSSAIESGTRPHLIFAKLLYYELEILKLDVKLGEELKK